MSATGNPSTDELAPYRHTEIVRVEECVSCALKAKTTRYRVEMTKAVGLPIAIGVPWALVAWLSLPHAVAGTLLAVIFAAVFVAVIIRGLNVAEVSP